MATDLDKLLALLEVERIDKYLFIGRSPPKPARIYGGQVLAQSLNAAGRTVDAGRHAHSVHAYFLRPGDPGKQIIYEVDPIRDGKSFVTRRVVAKQDGVPIFSTSMSFHRQEQGLSHQLAAPDVAPPEELESDHRYWTRMAQRYPDQLEAPTVEPIERKTVRRRDYPHPQPQEPQQFIWFRALGELGDDHRRHQTVLTYLSDSALVGTALLPHPCSTRHSSMQFASLDHALWFHRPFRADEYLLYALDSPTAAAARGFSRGAFYTRDGVLVASAAQESLLRLPRD